MKSMMWASAKCRLCEIEGYEVLGKALYDVCKNFDLNSMAGRYSILFERL